ncbi:MAG: hybrid sensor histidine kinase/response regulator [Ramlibacter sp.]
MTSAGAPFERKLSAIFAAEATEHVQRMQACLLQLEGGAAGAEQGRSLQLLFRATHSLKGAARAVGRREVEAVCHVMESLLVALQRGRLAWSSALGDALYDAAGAIERHIAGGPGPAAAGELALLLPRLAQFEAAAQRSAPAGAEGERQQATQPAPAPLCAAGGGAAALAAPRDAVPVAPDRTRPETVRIPAEHLERLLHDVEELVAVKLGVERRVQTVASARTSLAALQAATAGTQGTGAAALAEHGRQLRAVEAAARHDRRELEAAADALLTNVKKALLLPAASLSPFLVATVRELARSQGKDVQLRLEGDNVQMDRRLLQELREPLVHLLRNAIAHGIERAEVRARRGKASQGQLTVALAPRSGGRVVVTVADDGGGVDTDRLVQAAREAGVAVPAQPQPGELLQLVFGSGVSTAQQLTHVAGRGEGLAIVRDTVERLGGTVTVDSAPGQGTAFTMELPLSLATLRAIEVRASGQSYLVPTVQVDRCVRFATGELGAVGAQLTAPLGEQRVPVVGLAALLGSAAVPAAGTDKINCLVLRSGQRLTAVAVEEVRGEQEVLSKPVGRGLTKSTIVSGAALAASGLTLPILNVAELVRLAAGDGRPGAPAMVLAPAARRTPRRILLAEDSITSRTLLKNILELAGYGVELAADGAEALEKLRAGRFDAVVSDIEMPNLDGIGLTRAIRADAALARLPVILVTSLASREDRERGAEAGASAYIVKSSFDQGNLLQAVEELA